VAQWRRRDPTRQAVGLDGEVYFDRPTRRKSGPRRQVSAGAHVIVADHELTIHIVKPRACRSALCFFTAVSKPLAKTTSIPARKCCILSLGRVSSGGIITTRWQIRSPSGRIHQAQQRGGWDMDNPARRERWTNSCFRSRGLPRFGQTEMRSNF
jgi:hypothetical protein